MKILVTYGLGYGGDLSAPYRPLHMNLYTHVTRKPTNESLRTVIRVLKTGLKRLVEGVRARAKRSRQARTAPLITWGESIGMQISSETKPVFGSDDVCMFFILIIVCAMHVQNLG